MVLVNSGKGAEALSMLAGLHVEERGLTEAVAGNLQLRRPSFATKQSKELKGLLGKMAFDEAFEASSTRRKFMLGKVKRSKALAPLRAAKRLARRRKK